MTQDPKNENIYLDLRAQQQADKSFMGGTRLSTRTALFFFIGVLAMVAFAAMYFHADQRLSLALNTWKNAQRVAGAVTELGRAIDDVRIFDARVRDTGDPVATQGHRRSIDRVGVALDTLQRIPQADTIRDPIITTRDAFANYSSEFTAVVEQRAKLGVNENAGLNGERRIIATKIRELMDANGLSALLEEFDILDASPDSDPAPVAGDARMAVGESYENLGRLLERSTVDDDVKQAITQQLQRHAAVVAAILDIKAKTEEEILPFDDILDYVGPSLRAITDFSEQFGRLAPAAFEKEHLLVRQLVVVGSIAILAVLILFGLILLRSVTRPVRRLAETALQLADGDRTMSVPLRGNQDSIGDMARSLDSWLDHMAEIDHLRTELDDARMRLALGAIAEAVEKPADEAVAGPEMDTVSGGQGGEPAKPARPDDAEISGMTPTVKEEPPVMPPLPTLPPEPTVQPPSSMASAQPSGQISSPIGSASKQLSQFSEFVTDAARDVERTETLIQALSDTTRHITELEGCVAMIRDEANLLVFRAPNRPPSQDDETLVYLPGGEQQPSQEGRRFDTIRQTVNRAERLIIAARGSLDTVNVVAQEIASTASSQALAATNKLLSQSEYLQNMLDDLVHKLGPSVRTESYESDRSRQDRLDRKGDGDG